MVFSELASVIVVYFIDGFLQVVPEDLKILQGDEPSFFNNVIEKSERGEYEEFPDEGLKKLFLSLCGFSRIKKDYFLRLLNNIKDFYEYGLDLEMAEDEYTICRDLSLTSFLDKYLTIHLSETTLIETKSIYEMKFMDKFNEFMASRFECLYQNGCSVYSNMSIKIHFDFSSFPDFFGETYHSIFDPSLYKKMDLNEMFQYQENISKVIEYYIDSFDSQNIHNYNTIDYDSVDDELKKRITDIYKVKLNSYKDELIEEFNSSVVKYLE